MAKAVREEQGKQKAAGAGLASKGKAVVIDNYKEDLIISLYLSENFLIGY